MATMNETARSTTRTRPLATRALLGLAAIALLAPAATRAEQGALVQRPGAKGCISESGDPRCAEADLLKGAFSVAVSADGRFAYATLIDSGAVATFARNPQNGTLAQLTAPAGCISQSGSNGTCTTGRALHAPLALAISPDARNVYVISQQRDPVTLSSIVTFSRDPVTGVLTQLAGTKGCISEDIGGGICAPGVATRVPTSIAVSRDGKNVYVTSRTDAVTVFAREATSGVLTQLPEPQGCISQSGNDGHCTKGRALDGAASVVVSRDGRFAYVGSEISEGIAVFARNAETGALTQLPGEAGCISDEPAEEGCSEGFGLGGPGALALSPNGRSLYVASPVSNEVAVLARDATTGVLAHVECLTQGGSAACDAVFPLRQPYALTVSPDNGQVYVTARDSNAINVFRRHRKSGTLTQLAGLEGCISDDGSEGLCVDGRALDDPRSVTVSKDGKFVYVAAQSSAAIAILKRKH
jgi:DNA-binding beta-propeller fold protein YncE